MKYETLTSEQANRLFNAFANAYIEENETTSFSNTWYHFGLNLTAHGTQKEHMDIAEACKSVFVEQFPTVAEALEWI